MTNNNRDNRDNRDNEEQSEIELISSVVSLAKINRLYYEELIRNGFSKEEALQLTVVQVSTMFKPQN